MQKTEEEDKAAFVAKGTFVFNDYLEIGILVTRAYLFFKEECYAAISTDSMETINYLAARRDYFLALEERLHWHRITHK